MTNTCNNCKHLELIKPVITIEQNYHSCSILKDYVESRDGVDIEIVYPTKFGCIYFEEQK